MAEKLLYCVFMQPILSPQENKTIVTLMTFVLPLSDDG